MPGGVVKDFDLPRGNPRSRFRAASCRLAAKISPPPRGQAPFFFCRRWRLQASRAGQRRSSDSTLGIPHQLHALSAGNLAGTLQYFSSSDAGGDPHRHGDRQRLDVRRLHRCAEAMLRRIASPSGARRCSRAGCIRNTPRSRAPWRGSPATRSRRCAGRGRAAGFDRQNDDSLSAWSCRRRISSEIARSSRRRRRLPSSWRAADRGIHRSGVAGSADLARRDGRRYCSSAKASRSAMPLNFGGPYVGLFATRQEFLRQMPGRLCGERSTPKASRLCADALTREQHIRRDKATSNICTNRGLCALAFSIQ